MKNLLLIIIAFCLLSCNDDDSWYKKDYEMLDFDYENIDGKWYTTNEIDSTLVIFDESSINAYIYERKTQKLLEKISLGRWYIDSRYYPKMEYSNKTRIYLYLFNTDDYYYVSFDDDFNTLSFYGLPEPKLSGLDLTRIREE